MEWPSALSPIRAVVFECLKCPEAKDEYFTAEDIAELCNYSAGLDGTHGIDSTLVGLAFSRGAEREYILTPFNSLVQGSDPTSDYLYAYVSQYLVKGEDRYTAVGRFSSDNERSIALERLTSNNNSRTHFFRRWSDIAAIHNSDVGEAFRKKYGDIESVSARASARKRSSCRDQSVTVTL